MEGGARAGAAPAPAAPALGSRRAAPGPRRAALHLAEAVTGPAAPRHGRVGPRRAWPRPRRAVPRQVAPAPGTRAAPWLGCSGASTAGRLSVFWTVMARSAYFLGSSGSIRTYIFRMTARCSCLCSVCVCS